LAIWSNVYFQAGGALPIGEERKTGYLIGVIALEIIVHIRAQFRSLSSAPSCASAA